MNVAAIVIIGIAVVIGFLVWFFEFRVSPEDKILRRLGDELREEGLPAEAVVQKIDYMIAGTSGAYGATHTYFEMTLEVKRPDGQTVEVSENIFAPDKRFSVNPAYGAYVGKVGAVIPVIVHPTETGVLKIDEERLMKRILEHQETDSPTQ